MCGRALERGIEGDKDVGKGVDGEMLGGKGRFDLATMVGWLILRGWGMIIPFLCYQMSMLLLLH